MTTLGARESFRIDAHVVRQLGDQLITDATQALLELIKNSYDADAEWVTVQVQPDAAPPQNLGLPPTAVGLIVIEDNGHGMAPDVIRKGWLVISFSLKRMMKARGEATKKGRTPLGDKGLGRLSTIKLGDTVELTTYADKAKPGYKVILRWGDFVAGKTLDEVFATINEAPPIGRTGTRLAIYGLTQPDYWEGEFQLKGLQKKLFGLVSPFEEFQGFRIKLQVGGKPIDLFTLTPELRKSATLTFRLRWDGSTLTCDGRAKIGYFRGNTNQDDFESLVGDGSALFDFLKSRPSADGFHLKRSERQWYVEFSDSKQWDKIVGEALSCRDPGPFRGEIDGFDLRVEQGVFSAMDYKEYVKQHSGVGVYRDGFGIHMETDWLKLGLERTSGASWYSLRWGNTIGYVAISAAENPNLTEKSDREGFIDNEYSRGFLKILDEFVRFQGRALDFLRRDFNDFRKQEADKNAKLSKNWSSGEAIQRIREVAKNARATQKQVREAEETHRERLNKVHSVMKNALSADHLPSKLRKQVEQALADFDMAMDEWSSRRRALDEHVSALADEEKVSAAILGRFEELQNQIAEVYETVGTGLVAQALAHDIHALIDDLLGRTHRVAKKVPPNPHLAEYTTHVRAVANSIRKQLTILDPMLRASRTTYQEVMLSRFVSEFVEMRKDRLSRLGISVQVETQDDFTIKFNTGHLLQVLDNLVRNSEYWLRLHAAHHEKAPLEIHVVIAEPEVLIWDTGPGVRPAIEKTLFELFVSDKPRGQGNGLGLYIVTQVLERAGCSIRLSPERNEAKRRYKFVLDMSGAMT